MRPSPSLATLVGRALTLRCPACGTRGIVRRWLRLDATCPACHQPVDRPEPGYYLGALMLNLVAAELLLAAVGLVVIVTSWPTVPWNGLLYGGALLMVVAPVVLYPVTKLVWLAVDLALQPEFGGREGSPPS